MVVGAKLGATVGRNVGAVGARDTGGIEGALVGLDDQ